MRMATGIGARRWDFLNGDIQLERGSKEDYRKLSHLHYARGDPATCAGVWRAVYSDFGSRISDFGLNSNPPTASGARIPNPKSQRVVAVAMLSYPVPSSRAREGALGLCANRDRETLRWLNANLRTISRVIVHPQFRALGLASELVRRVLDDCPVRYVEAFAVMGKVVPFFTRAGMKEVSEGYFLWDREEKSNDE